MKAAGRVAAIVSLAAVLLAGCGGDAEKPQAAIPSAPTPARPSIQYSISSEVIDLDESPATSTTDRECTLWKKHLLPDMKRSWMNGIGGQLPLRQEKIIFVQSMNAISEQQLDPPPECVWTASDFPWMH